MSCRIPFSISLGFAICFIQVSGIFCSVCSKLPSGNCFVDCTQENYRVVCSNITGNPLHSDLVLFSGLEAPFELLIWDSPGIERVGGSSFTEMQDLIIGLVLQNVPNLVMFPEIGALSQLKELAIQNAPKLTYLPLEMLPRSVEKISLFQTGISQFLNDREAPSSRPTIKSFTIENQIIRHLNEYFKNFPNIETVQVRNCHIIYSLGDARPFATVRPIKSLRLENNTFESVIPGYQLKLFQYLLRSLNTDSTSAIELVHNDFPIGKRSTRDFDMLAPVWKLSLRGSAFEDYNTLQNVFESFSNLRILDLGETAIPQLKGGVFRGLPALEELYLDGNQLRQISEQNYFEGFQAKNFSYLDISDNDLRGLPGGLEAWATNLLFVNVAGNQLDHNVFSGTEKYFPRLRILDESNNAKKRFRSIMMGNMKSMTSLDISCNSFVNVTFITFIGLPKSVRKLNMTFCTARERERPKILKGAFGHLPELEELVMGQGYLRSNIFTRLKEMPVKSAASLKILQLPENKITKLMPNGSLFSMFKALLHLNLRKNQLQSITDSCFFPLSRLTHLDLSSNGIFAITAKSFGGLHSLTDLDLSGNLMKLIEPTAFEAVPKLQALMLGGNILYSLDGIIGKTLHKSLVHLDVSKMPLSCIPPTVFQKFRKLKWLYLNDSVPLFVDMDTKLNVTQQMRKIPMHPWAPVRDCAKDCLARNPETRSADELYLMFLVDSVNSVVYQDLYILFPRLHQSRYKDVKERLAGVLCETKVLP